MRPARILWAAPYCLHDTSSGAAIHVRGMFKQLCSQGIDLRVLSALTFDSPRGTRLFPQLEQERKRESHFLALTEADILYEYQNTASPLISAMTSAEERIFFTRYLQVLAEYKPDMIVQFGGGVLEMSIRAEARRRGIPLVFCVTNGSYRGYDFPDTELLLAISASTARMYGQQCAVPAGWTGPFIEPSRVIAPQRNPHYITFINPEPNKGTSIVARLAMMARTNCPDMHFLVVQSRGDWYVTAQALGLAGVDFSNLHVAPHVADMREIYAQTRILLAPSLWYESFGLVAVEAAMNGIPVLASNSGGLPEAVGDGGLVLDAPQACVENHMHMPDEASIQPWFDALHKLNGPEYPQWCERARNAAEFFSLERSRERLLALLEPLLARAFRT